jgi:hypothetical protein
MKGPFHFWNRTFVYLPRKVRIRVHRVVATLDSRFELIEVDDLKSILMPAASGKCRSYRGELTRSDDMSTQKCQ